MQGLLATFTPFYRVQLNDVLAIRRYARRKHDDQKKKIFERGKPKRAVISLKFFLRKCGERERTNELLENDKKDQTNEQKK